MVNCDAWGGGGGSVLAKSRYHQDLLGHGCGKDTPSAPSGLPRVRRLFQPQITSVCFQLSSHARQFELRSEGGEAGLVLNCELKRR